MDADAARDLRTLLETQQVVALATLHRVEPAVSTVPYALLPADRGFVVHVSRLATHTADMLAAPVVSLLVTALRRGALRARRIDPRRRVRARHVARRRSVRVAPLLAIGRILPRA